MILSLIRVLFAAVLALIGGFAAIVSFPFDRNASAFHFIARSYSTIVLKFCGVKLLVEGLENVPFNRTYVYVSNHASQFDIPAVIAGLPDRIRIVYKKELEKIPFFGWGLRWPGVYISIDRGRGAEAFQSIEAAAEKIRSGSSVLLFAEGTRSPDGRLQPFKRGAFNLAVKAKVPVVPLTINGSYRILSRDSLRIRPGTITLVLDKPVMPPAPNGKETELQLRDRVHTAIEQHYVNQG